MRQRDSSRTRVRPIFHQLAERDPTGSSWLNALLALPKRRGGVTPAPTLRTPLLRSYCWADPVRRLKERSLPAPRGLLEWLIEHVEAPRTHSAWGSGDVREWRERLVRGDEEAREAARRQIQRSQAPSWAVLERASQPDVFLETGEAWILIEGKRTERGPTTDTTWMRGRHQMLRHIDAGWDLRGARQIYGFFIVEGKDGADAVEVPERWREAARATVSPEAIARSLPHRSADEKQTIARAFLGVTTWQAVCRELKVDWRSLSE
jgi:hypothetical protein